MGDRRVAITGATGRLGGRVARRLAARGIPLRLVVRDAARAPALPGAEPRVASYDDRAALTRALDGVDTLFFVSGAESPTRLRQHFTVIDAALDAGVAHVVYTSFAGAAPDATFTLARDHWATEQRLGEAKLATTVLRDNLYLDFLPRMVGDDGVLRGPAGHGRVAAVAQDDVAEVAAAVLADPVPHAGLTYELTGLVALTLGEIAAVLSRHVGREVTYHDESLDEAYRSRAQYRAAPWQVDGWVSTYLAIKAGELARVTGDVERLAGHPPRGLEEVLVAAGPAALRR